MGLATETCSIVLDDCVPVDKVHLHGLSARGPSLRYLFGDA